MWFEGFSIKVLHITESIKGGVATYLNEIYKSQEDFLGEDNVFFTAPYDSVNQLNFSVDKKFEFNSKNKRSLKYFWKYYKFVSRIIAEVKPDIIHAHSTFSGLFVRIHKIMHLQRYKVIYSPHGWSFLMDISWLKRSLYFFIEYFLSWFTYKIINISQYEFDRSVKYGIPKKKSKIIYNGMSIGRVSGEISHKLNIDKSKINLLFVGRLDYQKGIDILLDAFSNISGDNYNLHIAGIPIRGGTHIKTVSNVFYHGWLSSESLSFLYSNIDVVLVPSRWEGFGYVALEAMKHSRPVIASNRGALPELVVDQYNGYLFDLDKPQNLQSIIENLSRDKLIRMGMNGNKIFLEKFLSKQMNKKILNLYLQAIGHNNEVELVEDY